jgi:DNA-binding transcriptional LysR family regulator
MRDLNQMAVFLEVAKARSFTAAARALRVPRSTVSLRIAELEARLGAKLLHRTTRKVQLTATGHSYYERCVRILADVDEADRLVADATSSARGTLRLSAPFLFGSAFLAPIVAAYLEKQPEVFVELLLSDHKRDLVEDNIDLAIRVGPVDDALVARRLGVGASVLCASREYLRKHPAPRTPRELAAHVCLAQDAPDGIARWNLVQGDRSVDVEVPVRVRASSPLFTRQAMRCGLGIALMPSFLCAEEVQSGHAEAVLPGWSSSPVAIHAVYLPNRYLAPRVRAFVDVLVATFARGAPWEVTPRTRGSGRERRR